MKLAVNTRLLLDGKLEGIGWFTYQVFYRIVKSHPEHRFYFIFDRPCSEKFIFASNVTPVIIGPPARHPILWNWWFEHSLKKTLKKIRPDIFISTDGYLCLSTKVKSLAVIHDLNFEYYPQHLRWLVKKYLLYYFPRFAKKAHRIATVSEYSKSDIANKYGISPHKIDVVYNGVNEEFMPLNEEEKKAACKEFADGCPYFVYIGALLPRKNISRLLQAFDIFKHENPGNTKLVLAGAKMFHTQEVERTFKNMKHKPDVIFLGRVEQDKLKFILGGALALCYVSYFEGFGIPLIEAMYAEVPLITSDKTSLPEIAGNAALIVNPFSVKSIATALQQIYSDQALRESLVDKAKVLRQKYSWEKTAAALWNCIEKCLEGS